MYNINIKSLLIACLIFSVSNILYANNQPQILPSHLIMAKQAFSHNMARQYHVKQKDILTILNTITYNGKVIKHITHPAEKHPWNWYQSYFITAKRIKDGKKYWHKHQQTLEYASKKYGVDPNVIVAIIGVETSYGQRLGYFKAIDALGTLAFYYPPRAKFFSKELAQFILLCQQQHLNYHDVKSSYAGALGIPQFMPSSYRHYAVNYGNSKYINLFSSHDDAIVSVANYLAKNGWKSHQPIAIHIKQQPSIVAQLISTKTKFPHTLSWFAKHKLRTNPQINQRYLASIITLDDINPNKYWLVFKNFKAIMSYNTSKNYAMAIYQLSNKIKGQHRRG